MSHKPLLSVDVTESIGLVSESKTTYIYFYILLQSALLRVFFVFNFLPLTK